MKLAGTGRLGFFAADVQVSSTQAAMHNHRMRFAETQIIREDIMAQERREFVKMTDLPQIGKLNIPSGELTCSY